MYKQINESQFKTAYRSASLWFSVLYMEVLIVRFNELEDDVKRKYLINEIYDNGNGPDKKESGTRTRVNSLFRIIESNRVVDTLEVAVKSDRLKYDFPEAYKTAIDLLGRITSGEFKLNV